jgi:hypothetical protein
MLINKSNKTSLKNVEIGSYLKFVMQLMEA